MGCLGNIEQGRDWFMKNRCLLLLSILVFSGCSTLSDAPRNILGFSTKEMEDARGQSVYQSYNCEFSQCFSAVLALMEESKINVFSRDEERGLIVLMGVPGVVDTTEVGVFFFQVPQQKVVKVEVASRSAPAKRKVARLIFSKLGTKLNKD